MNRKTASMSIAALLAALAAGSAKADLLPGAPIEVPFDHARATIEFEGSSAGYTGNLYFLGWGSEFDVIEFAPSSDETGLGQWLFNNHQSDVGDQWTLDFTFNAGDVLHFAYDIVAPDHVSDELFRSDIDTDRHNFAYDADSGFVGIEDLRLPNSDEDFNDMMFSITYAQVPGPTVLAAMAGAFACLGRRRRR